MVILVGIGLFVCGFIMAALLIRLGVKSLCQEEKWVVAKYNESMECYESIFTPALVEIINLRMDE